MQTRASKDYTPKETDSPSTAWGKGWRSGFYRPDEVGEKGLKEKMENGVIVQAVPMDGRWNASNPYSKGSRNSTRWLEGVYAGFSARLRMEDEDRNQAGRVASEVTDAETVQKVWSLYKGNGGKMTYAEIEEVAKLNLRKANGMTAYRIIQRRKAANARAEKPRCEAEVVEAAA
jgi:hypothetical protein